MRKVLTIALVSAAAAILVTSLVQGALHDRERARWEARLLAERDSTTAWRTRTSAFRIEMQRLRGDSAALYRDWRAADVAADTASARLESIFATIADTAARRRARDAAAAIRQPAAGCSLVVINCEARAAAAEAAQADAEARANSLAFSLDTTTTKWKAAERRADRRFFLGAGAGYGAVLSGGKLYAGPGAHVGVEYRFSFRDLFTLVF